MSTLMTYSVLCTKKLKLVFNNYLTFKVFQVYKTVVYLQLTNTHTNMIAKMIECPDCNGDGERYEDTSRQCTKTPWQECCGGCGYYYDCENCNGTGEVEEEDEE